MSGDLKTIASLTAFTVKGQNKKIKAAFLWKQMGWCYECFCMGKKHLKLCNSAVTPSVINRSVTSA